MQGRKNACNPRTIMTSRYVVDGLGVSGNETSAHCTSTALALTPEEDGTSICLRAYYVNKVCVVCN